LPAARPASRGADVARPAGPFAALFAAGPHRRHHRQPPSPRAVSSCPSKLIRFGSLAALIVAIGLVASPAHAGRRAREATVVAKQALEFYKQGKWSIATELYKRCYRLDPQHPEYLYGAARSEHKAERYRAAINLYEQLLGNIDGNSPHASKARGHLADARRSLATDQASKSLIVTPGKAKKGSSVSPLGVGALVVGAAAIVAAGAVFGIAATDNTDIDDKLKGYTRANPNPAYSFNQASADREDANNRIRLSWAIGGVGLVGVGVGTWLLLRDPDKSTARWHIAPTTAGAVFTYFF